MNFIFLINYDKSNEKYVERVVNLEKITCVARIKDNVDDNLVVGFDDGDVPLITDFNEPSSQYLWELLKSRCENCVEDSKPSPKN